MIRRYDLTRSDNYPYNGKVSYVCSGNGYLTVVTGFSVKSAIVTFSTLPLTYFQNSSMSSSSSFSSSSISSSSLSTFSESSGSSFSTSSSSESSGGVSESSSSSLSSSSSSINSFSSPSSDSTLSSTSSITEVISGLPRLYVYGYTTDGFIVRYENIPEEVGYIEFSYSAL